MDNIAHTLAGLALAEAGLKRRTALGTVTLAIAANLPDIDALTYMFGDGADSLSFRRGWTHGPIAWIVLPLLLAAVIVGWDRAFGDRPGRRHTPVNTGWLVVLAMIGVLSHPLLDLMNTYGVRLLMPFSGRWFYGDALFIVDPWLWLTLAVGVILSRWRARRIRDASAGVVHKRMRSSRELPTDARWVTRPARVAIGLFIAYAAAMAISGRIGRVIVERSAQSAQATRTMVGPVAVNPLRRDVVRELSESYEIGTLRFDPRATYAARATIDRGRDAPGVAAAKLTHEGAQFLSWARFPFFQSEYVGDSIRVRMSDARYADERGRGWASLEVMVPRPQ
jgi:inner membrane protein